MAPATSSSLAKRLIRFSGSLRRTEAPRLPSPPLSPTPKKLKSMEEVMARARYAVVDRADYGNVSCQQCRSGDRPDELLLCDKCDKGFHMKCVRPIVVRVPIGSWLCPKCSDRRRVRSRDFFVSAFFGYPFCVLWLRNATMVCVSLVFLGFSQKKIIDFFRIQKCCDKKDKFSSPLGKVLLLSSIFDIIIITVIVIFIEICVSSTLVLRDFICDI